MQRAVLREALSSELVCGMAKHSIEFSCCRSPGEEGASADRIAELERQLAEANSGKDPEMNDENTRIVRMLADVSLHS